MMTQQFHPATVMMHEAGTLYNNNNNHQNKTPPPALYHSPPHPSPDQSPKSEPGTPDKRPKLNVTIPQDTTKQGIEPGVSKLVKMYEKELIITSSLLYLRNSHKTCLHQRRSSQSFIH